MRVRIRKHVHVSTQSHIYRFLFNLRPQIFHLRNIRATQFLSKSFLGFLAFNILPYSLFGAEILSAQVTKDRNAYASFFSGCYAFLLLVVLVFFLIYGVEVFFKIRGQFIYDCGDASTATENQNVNVAQVHHARFGLLSQAIMMIIIVGFLASETLGDFWKNKVPVSSRNWYDIVFRSFEVGFALWFPCCLWNSMAPEQLWILNPRKLLSRQVDPVASTSIVKVSAMQSPVTEGLSQSRLQCSRNKHHRRRDNRFWCIKTAGFATTRIKRNH